MAGKATHRRGELLGLLGLFGLLACGDAPGLDVCDAPAGDPSARPSFVVIVADALRADYVGGPGAAGEGFQASVSPALDRFAAESVDFRAAFSEAPWTKPSVATLLTGLEPQLHGVLNHEGEFFRNDPHGGANRVGVLPDELETLAETLGQAGYQTAAFVSNVWLAPGYGFEQGFEHYEVVPRERLGAVFARADRWLAGRDPARPFLVYLHLMEVHSPYDAPEAFVEMVRESGGAGPSRSLSEAEVEAIPEILRTPAWARNGGAYDLREWRTHYAAGVAAFDAGFGIFLKRAREQGWLDHSIVAVTADHGQEIFDHGGWDHGTTLFDEQLHVPLMVRLPGGRRGGRQVETIVSLIDLHPTLLELAGLRPPEDRRGRSLTDWLCERDADARPGWAFASATKLRPQLYALRTDRYKFILDAGTGAGALFDLEADPQERRNVAAEDRGTADALARQLWRLVKTLEQSPRGAPATAPVSPEMIQQLEALGYTDAR